MGGIKQSGSKILLIDEEIPYSIEKYMGTTGQAEIGQSLIENFPKEKVEADIRKDLRLRGISDIVLKDLEIREIEFQDFDSNNPTHGHGYWGYQIWGRRQYGIIFEKLRE